jgi:hypothetical protein
LLSIVTICRKVGYWELETRKKLKLRTCDFLPNPRVLIADFQFSALLRKSIAWAKIQKSNYTSFGIPKKGLLNTFSLSVLQGAKTQFLVSSKSNLSGFYPDAEFKQ